MFGLISSDSMGATVMIANSNARLNPCMTIPRSYSNVLYCNYPAAMQPARTGPVQFSNKLRKL